MLYFYIIFISISEKIAQEIFLIVDRYIEDKLYFYICQKKIQTPNRLLKMRNLDVIHSSFTGGLQSVSPEKVPAPTWESNQSLNPVMMVLVHRES